jgi:ArsR family transcriptional regulator
MSIILDRTQSVDYSRHMDIYHALIAFSALSQETRLQVFKLLVEYGRSGAPAGSLSNQLDIPHNTLSFHLSHLSHAGLVTSRKQGRLVIYVANCDMIESLIAYLKENCCIREEGKSSKCQDHCKPKPEKGEKA